MERFDVDKMMALLKRAGTDPASLPKGTREALELAYLLSTQVEEGRPLRFGFVGENYVRHLPERRLDRVVSEPDEIRRLCLATDPSEHVWRLHFDAASKTVSVVGITTRPSFDMSPLLFDEVVIESHGFGSVSIATHHGRIVYARARHFIVDAEALLPTLIPSSVLDAVSEHCCEVLEDHIRFGRGFSPLAPGALDEHGDILKATMRETAAAFVPAAILVTLRRMVELGHGGAVILSPHESISREAFAKGFGLEKFERGSTESYGYNWALMTLIMAVGHLRLAKEGHILLKELQDGDTDRPLDERLRVAEVDRLTAEYARMWARLACIDGMVVFDWLVEPRLFGAITATPPSFIGA